VYLLTVDCAVHDVVVAAQPVRPAAESASSSHIKHSVGLLHCNMACVSTNLFAGTCTPTHAQHLNREQHILQVALQSLQELRAAALGSCHASHRQTELHIWPCALLLCCAAAAVLLLLLLCCCTVVMAKNSSSPLQGVLVKACLSEPTAANGAQLEADATT
jgi:hypothetical protein